MEYLVGFAVGAVSVLVVGSLLLLMKRGSDRDGSRATGSGGVDAQRLFSIADDLEEFYEQTSRPSDLIDHAKFSEGVALLKRCGCSSEELLSYGKGTNAIVACMALEALSSRDDEVEILESLLADIDNVATWVAYFALRALDERITKPILARVLCSLDQSWSSIYKFEVLKGFVGSRLKKEEHPTLAGSLDSLSPACCRKVPSLSTRYDDRQPPVSGGGSVPFRTQRHQKNHR